MLIISLPLFHFNFNWFYKNFYCSTHGSDSVFVNHPQSFTQALQKEIVICVTSCMQINQPKMKIIEQSTNITLKVISRQPYPGEGRLGLVAEERGTLTLHRFYSRNLHPSMHAVSTSLKQLPAQGRISYVRKTQSDAGMLA